MEVSQTQYLRDAARIMSLFKKGCYMSRCPECHSKISEGALVCPHCGFRASGDLVPIKDLAITKDPVVLAVPEADVMQNGLLLLSEETNKKLVAFITNADNAARLFPSIYQVIKDMMARGDVKYTADFTKAAEELMKKGELVLQPDKLGRIMPQLRDPKTSRVYEMVRLKIEDIPVDMAPSLISLQMQMSMAQVLNEIKEVAANVEALRLENQADRIAEAESVWLKLQQAVRIEDSRLREMQLLSIANSATESRCRLQANLVLRLTQLREGSTKTKANNANAALSELTSIALMARSEYAAYTLLDESEAAQECLKQLSSFMSDNKLDDRDLLLEINSQSGIKRPDIVDGFHQIAVDITGAFNQLNASNSHLLDDGDNYLFENPDETDDSNEPRTED